MLANALTNFNKQYYVIDGSIVLYVHQGCMYLIKNTVKIITI